MSYPNLPCLESYHILERSVISSPSPYSRTDFDQSFHRILAIQQKIFVELYNAALESRVSKKNQNHAKKSHTTGESSSLQTQNSHVRHLYFMRNEKFDNFSKFSRNQSISTLNCCILLNERARLGREDDRAHHSRANRDVHHLAQSLVRHRHTQALVVGIDINGTVNLESENKSDLFRNLCSVIDPQ